MPLVKKRKPLGFVFFGTLLQLVFAAKRAREFGGHVKVDTVLIGHVLQTMSARDLFSCSQQCLRNRKCKSFNFGYTSSSKGFCELNTAVLEHQKLNKFLVKKNGYFFVSSYRQPKQVQQSCLEYRKSGRLTSGFYYIKSKKRKVFKVYCDMTSERNSTWTLVLSYSYQNIPSFRISLGESFPVNMDNPNWSHYRLSRKKMKTLMKISTHWRITCSFPVFGVDYIDYLRASFIDFDPFSLNTPSNGVCKKVEKIDIRGSDCKNCTALFIQRDQIEPLYYYDYKGLCYFGGKIGKHLSKNEYFGKYQKNFTDPLFRCTSGPQQTTNMWFGGYV